MQEELVGLNQLKTEDEKLMKNQRTETFLKHWQKWCNYVSDKWPDCISLLYGK